ncbi:MAG TPA: antibiotic biosynthesis monooxygenase [Burkholderiales bacterium]|nr:antibiotic biosynthesis monooxygenase [Burkholderiales bacterium]
MGDIFVHIERHRVAAPRRRTFVAAAVKRARALRAAGCLRCDVVQDMDEAGTYLLCKVYENRNSYRRLRRAMHAAIPTPELSLFATNCYPADRAMQPVAHKPADKPDRYGRYLHFGIWQIQPRHREAFLRGMLLDARDSVRLEKGCYRFDMLQDTRRRNCFYLYQIYESAQWHDVDHVAMPHVKRLLGRPDWPAWPLKRPGFPMGSITDTGRSFLVRGRVVWSSELDWG